MNSTLNLLRCLPQEILPWRTFSLFFLLLCLSGFSSAQKLSLSPSLLNKPDNLNLQEVAHLSIQLNTKTIQASSLEDGSEVVKDEDLKVKLVKEREKISDEEESQEIVRSFYHKWGEDWVVSTARLAGGMISCECAKELLKRYKESLDGSIVKDDEILQNMWKETGKEVIEDEEGGLIYCW